MSRKPQTTLTLVLTLCATLMACATPYTEKAAATNTHDVHNWAWVLKHYQTLGEHRSGTKADRATALWLRSELQAQDIETKLQVWPLQVFQLNDYRLKAGDNSFETFPFWYPVPTGPSGLSAPLKLADFTEDNAEEHALKDSIALFRLPPGQMEFHYDVAPILDKAAEAGALAAVVVMDHPMKVVSAQNANAPYHQQALPLPALIAAESSAEELLSLANGQANVHFVIDGQNLSTEAVNIIGKIDRGAERWVVISTPVSGWFEVTNERGPGIALWLQLANWLKLVELDANILLTALSGHELAGMGMRALVESGELPTPDSVALWLHLGSGIAVETPLLSAVSSTTALAGLVNQTLIKQTAMIYWPENRMPKGSEQYVALQLGYPVVGLFGADPAIHSRLDQDPRIDDAEYNKIFNALQSMITLRLSSP